MTCYWSKVNPSKWKEGNEGNALFNDTSNTFYLRLYGIRHMLKDHCHGYSFQLAARDILYAPSHRQNSTYHNLCYTTCGALTGMRNRSVLCLSLIHWSCSIYICVFVCVCVCVLIKILFKKLKIIILLEGRQVVLFNDTLNTFSYGYMASDIIMVKGHSDSERGNPLPPHGLLFLISGKGSCICTIPLTG